MSTVQGDCLTKVLNRTEKEVTKKKNCDLSKETDKKSPNFNRSKEGGGWPITGGAGRGGQIISIEGEQSSLKNSAKFLPKKN